MQNREHAEMILRAPGSRSKKHRKLLLSMGIAALLVALIIYPFIVYRGAPSALFYRREERQFCIRCGSQKVEESRMSLDGAVKRRSKAIVETKLEGIVADHCDHWFLTVAFQEQFLDLGKFRWVHGTSGRMEGEPLYRQSPLIRAFASFSSTNIEQATDLFMFLNRQESLGGAVTAVPDGPAAPEMVKYLIQEAHQKFRDAGSTFRTDGPIVETP